MQRRPLPFDGSGPTRIILHADGYLQSGEIFYSQTY